MAVDEKLKPVAGWDLLWRGSFEHSHAGSVYVVDLDYFDFRERINLYRDGELVETESSPARFELEDGGSIEAALSLLGMKYVRFTDQAGHQTRFEPRKGTGEAWRASFDRRRPRLSKAIGVVSWLVLLVALLTQLPFIFDSTIGHLTGWEAPSAKLPGWADIAISCAGIVAALDRALQLKYNRWLDS